MWNPGLNTTGYMCIERRLFSSSSSRGHVYSAPALSDASKHILQNMDTSELSQLFRPNILHEPLTQTGKPIIENNLASNHEGQQVSRIYGIFREAVDNDPEFDTLRYLELSGLHELASTIFTENAKNWPSSKDVRIQVLTSLSKLAVDSETHFLARDFIKYLTMETWSEQEIKTLQVWLKSVSNYSGMESAHLNEQKVDTSTRQACTKLIDGIDSAYFASHLSTLLVNLSLSIGSPLLSASILSRAVSSGSQVPQQIIHACLMGLTVDNSATRQYQLKAFFHVTKILWGKSGPIEFDFSPDLSRRIVELGIKVSKDLYPSIAYETFQRILNLISRTSSSAPVPMRTCIDLLMLHLHHESQDRAAYIWNYVSKYYNQLKYALVDVNTASSLILRLSKYKRTLRYAKILAESVPDEAYSIDGLTEALLVYCARNADMALSQRIYDKLSAPFSLSVLSSFLRLHLSFGDAEGAEKIIKQITAQGGKLDQSDIICISEHLSRAYGTDKAIEFVLKSGGKVPRQKALGTLIKHEVDRGNYDYYDQFIENLLGSVSGDVRRMAISITAQRYCFGEEDQSSLARRLYQYWSLDEDSFKPSIVELNSFLDPILLGHKRDIFLWLAERYRDLGVDYGELANRIRKSQKLDKAQQAEWLADLTAVYRSAF